jgi:hypothetical protein
MPARMLVTTWREQGPAGCAHKLSAATRMVLPVMLRGRRTVAGVAAYFDQFLESVGGFMLCETEGDRVSLVGRCQCRGDRVHTLFGSSPGEVGHCTEEFVSPVAHGHVVGSDIRSHGLADEAQESVAGWVVLSVVDLFETVDVDEGEHEPAAHPAGALDFADHLNKAELSRPRARYVVGRGKFEIVSVFGARTARLGALTSRLLPVGGGPGAVVSCLGPISRRSHAVALGPQKNVLPARLGVMLQVVETSQAIATLGATITKLGRPITILRGQQPRRRGLVAQP